jgi:hypothetical protein
MTLPIAHHALVTAIPFFVPVLVILIGIGAITVRDRLRGDEPGA